MSLVPHNLEKWFQHDKLPTSGDNVKYNVHCRCVGKALPDHVYKLSNSEIAEANANNRLRRLLLTDRKRFAFKQYAKEIQMALKESGERLIVEKQKLHRVTG